MKVVGVCDLFHWPRFVVPTAVVITAVASFAASPNPPNQTSDSNPADTLTGIVVDFPLDIQGQQVGSGVSLLLHITSPDQCLSDIRWEDGAGLVVRPSDLGPVKKKKGGFELGFGIGGGGGSKKGGSSGSPSVPPGESHGAKPASGSKTGSGFGFAFPLFQTGRGGDCEKDLQAHFELPKGHEEFTGWGIVLTLINPRTKEPHSFRATPSAVNGRVSIIAKEVIP